MNNLIRTAKKFWCLEGFVAIIFTILALRSIYAAFYYPSFWNLLAAALMGIFSYWWTKRVLAKPTRYKSNFSNNYGSRDLDL